MKHEIPFGNSNWENGPTFLDFPLFLGIFQWDEPTKRVPFTAEPEIQEILTKWEAPRVFGGFTLVVYHLPKIPRNFFWDVNGKRFFGSSHCKIPRTSSEKVVPISRLGRSEWIFVYHLCISQFITAAPPPPPSYCVAFAPLVSPRGGAFSNFVQPGGRAFANPGAIPNWSFWHALGFLSEYNYTEDFTGKESRLAHLSRTGKKRVVKACSWFYACISSLLINELQI